MLYIKIGDESYPAKISTFNTQFGNLAVRIISEAPITNEGFLIIDENNNLICDYSDYIYLYREENNIKEYVNVDEKIIQTQCSYMGDIPSSAISKQISALNKRINDITPYTENKIAYYGENEKVFYNVPQGNVTVFFDNYNGFYNVDRVENRLIVSFDTLVEATNITISVQ